MRVLLVVLGLAVVGTLGLLCSDEGAQDVGATEEPAAAEEVAALRAAGGGHELDTAGVGTENTSPGRAQQAARDYVVRGTIAVSDAGGQNHEHEDGELVLGLKRDGEADFGRFVTVPVQQGRWELRLDALPMHVEGVSARLRGTEVVPECSWGVSLEAEDFEQLQPVDIWGRWLLPPILLRVVSATTGLDLADVRLVERPQVREPSDGPAHGRSSWPAIVRGATSPLRLQVDDGIRGDQDLWVHAPGHAWRKVSIYALDPSERRVVLEPGGDVRVVLAGAAPPEGAVVCLRPWRRSAEALLSDPQGTVGGYSLADALDELDPAQETLVRFAGVEAGRHLVTLELGPSQRSRLVLAWSSVDVDPRRSSTVTLTVPDQRALGDPVPVAGRLHVPAAWKSQISLELVPSLELAALGAVPLSLGIAEMQQVAPGIYSWNAGRLPPGRYSAYLDACGVLLPFAVGPTGNEGVMVDIPEPAEARLRFVDPEDERLLVPQHRPVWVANPPSWVSWSHSWWQHPHRLDDGSWTLQCVPGATIAISASVDGHGWSRTEHVLQPGSNELRVPMPRECGVRVELRDGNTEIPWNHWNDSEWDLELFDATGTSAARDVFWARATAHRPGTYTLRILGPKDYEPIQDRQVTVTAASYTTVQIPLQRAR